MRQCIRGEYVGRETGNDEAGLRYTLAKQLKLKDSFETETAGDGTSTIEVAKAGRSNGLLLDVGLPNMNRRKVCRALRRSRVA